jgi:hypothetical protein
MAVVDPIGCCHNWGTVAVIRTHWKAKSSSADNSRLFDNRAVVNRNGIQYRVDYCGSR